MGDSHAQRGSGRKRSCDDDGRKQKNRDAARKSREKKNKETSDLKQKNQTLVEENRILTQRKEDLERKLKECIEEITKHSTSGCVLPENVLQIIDSCSHDDFIPVGTQIVSVLNNDKMTGFSDGQPVEVVPTKQEHTMIRGLFSGDEFPTNLVDESRNRNLSRHGQSSSRSPTPKTAVQQSQSSSNSNTKVSFIPSWDRLQQQSFVEDSSSGPAQTVPNIDSDSYTLHSNVEEEVMHGQGDLGVVEDLPQAGGILSLGFTPQCNDNLVPWGGQNMVPIVKSNEIFKPGSSGSTTVSMNHTAELLSQAISNFDASEISEDLKKEFVRVTEHQELKDTNANETSHVDLYSIQNQMYTEEVMDESAMQTHQTCDPVLADSSASYTNTSVSWDQLLMLAKDHEQITVQIQGKDYQYSYKDLELFVNSLKQSNTTPTGYTVTEAQYSEFPMQENKSSLMSTYTDTSTSTFNGMLPPQQLATSTTLYQNVTDVSFTPQNHFIEHGQIINAVPLQQQVDVEPVQNGQLPTTVISMIEEDSLTKSSDTALDNVDYSENVKDLPSLSLTEDLSNIFEKKRRVHD